MEATEAGSLYYTVEADTAKLINSTKPLDKSLDGINKRFNKTDKAAKKTDFRMKEVSRSVKAATVSMGGLNRMLGAFLSIQGVAQISKMSDAWTELENRLRLITDTQEELNQSVDDVFNIAQRTSQSIDSVSQIYQRFGQNADALELSLSDVAEVTEIVAKAVAVSGGSAQASEAALVQFGQALASDTLRGEELNSVMEQTPALAKAIADGLGITIGQLREVAAQGKITATELIGALRRSADSVESQFSTRVKTVSQAWTEMRNQLTKYLGESQSVETATDALSSTLAMLADNIDTVVNLLLTAGAGALAKYVAQVGLSIVTSGRAAIAARAQAAEELKLANAHVAATQAALNHSRTQVGLLTSTSNATKASEAYSAALTRQAAAQKAARTAGTGLTALLGGPLGIASLAVSAATAVALFGNNANEAVTPTSDFAQELASVRGEAEKLEKLKIQTRIREIKEELSALREEQSSGGMFGMPLSGQEWTDVQNKINDGTRLRIELEKQLANIQEKAKSGSGEDEVETPGENAKKRLQAMRDEIALLKQTGEARERLQAIQALGDDASQAQKDEAARLASIKNELEQQIQKREELKQAEQDNAEVISQMNRELAEAVMQGEELAIAQATARLNPFATEQDIQKVTALARAKFALNQEIEKEARLKREGQELENLENQYSPMGSENNRHQAELEGLRKLKEQELLTELEFNELKTAALREHEENKRRIIDETFRAQSDANELLMSSYDALGQAGTNALSGILSGTMSGSDALKSMANTILNEVIGSFVQLGIQYLKNQMIEKAAAASSVATAAATGGAIAASYAPAAAAASTATMGGAATMGMTAMSAAVPAMMGLFGGGRLNGGPVNPGKFYRINESGSPEILNTGGKQYLMMNGQSGNVQTMQSGGTSGGMVNNFNISVQSDGAVNSESPAGYEQFGRDLGKFIEAKFKEMEMKSASQGGFAWQQKKNKR